jgi:hypothetical protein
LLAILAAACAGSPEPMATLLPASVTPAGETATSHTAAPASTALPRASATISSPPTTGHESLITATASVFEPTPNATALIDSVVTHSAPQSMATLDSPDGQWRVEVLRSDCTPIGGDQLAYEQLLLHITGTGEVRLLADQLLYCGGLGAFGLEPLYWSSDSRYVYYSTARAGSPDGGGCGPWYRPIVRADIRSDERVDLAEGVPSPDGTLTAGYQYQEVIVWGRDVSEVVRATIPVTAGSFGPLAWAPDSQSLVYLLRESFCPPDTDPSLLVRLDLPGGQQTVLLEPPAPIFTEVAWDIPGELRLTDTDGQAWIYDLGAKTLTRAPA